jgi:hypothetical protein
MLTTLDKQVVIIEGKILDYKMKAIKNNQSHEHKPRGGLWTSAYDAIYITKWLHYCVAEQLRGMGDYIPKSINGAEITPSESARILTINSKDEWIDMVLKYHYVIEGKLAIAFIDWEKIVLDYDAIYLTNKGYEESKWVSETDYPNKSWFDAPNAYCWSIESTCWFRWCFESIVEKTYFTNEYQALVKYHTEKI